ncbi:VanZ family protein [Cohnella herbarum]|uniref:VanZ family protein n=1 Tax=Cohnella herbarum TaxID=2728023 RepID=A0A7Z2VP15_9BACL|nr:VanZ family protein [Cohnella herbarum]QJD86853.1 VanZ family protein [Cohnella herbarum]
MKRTKLLSGMIVTALFGLYLYALLKVILFKLQPIDVTFLWQQLQVKIENPHALMDRLKTGNTTPFHQISENMQMNSGQDFLNLVGNVALFMPLGVFLFILLKNNGLSIVGVMVLSFVLSLSLECAQAVFSLGVFDVDDLILNACGGLLGYLLYKIYFKLKEKAMVTSNLGAKI